MFSVSNLSSFNYRLVHSFTCAGILQTQYIKLCRFARLGTINNAYIRQGIYMYVPESLVYICMSINDFTVYNKQGYADLVAQAAELSMKAAIEEVQLLPHYEQDGEVSWFLC